MSDVNAIKSYLDFAGLSNLRAKAKDNQTSAAKEVGRQFEAMFVETVSYTHLTLPTILRV